MLLIILIDMVPALLFFGALLGLLYTSKRATVADTGCGCFDDSGHLLEDDDDACNV